MITDVRWDERLRRFVYPVSRDLREGMMVRIDQLMVDWDAGRLLAMFDEGER